MNVILPTLSAMLWAATLPAPNRPMSTVRNVKNPTSKNIVAPMGTPSANNSRMVGQSGAEKRERQPVKSNLGRVTTTTIARHSNHMTIAVATPQPTPPSLGRPAAPYTNR